MTDFDSDRKNKFLSASPKRDEDRVLVFSGALPPTIHRTLPLV